MFTDPAAFGTAAGVASMVMSVACVGYDTWTGRKPGLPRIAFKTLASTAFMVGALFFNLAGHPNCPIPATPDAPMPADAAAFFVEAAQCFSRETVPFDPRFNMFAALLLCFVGDVLLLFPEFFVAGLLSFLLGHLGFVGVFVVRSFDAQRFATFGAGPLLIFGWWIQSWLFPVAGKLLIPVAAYLLIILAMVGCAVAGSHGAVAVAAAVLFLLSDVGVARDKFIGHSLGNRMTLLLYYAAVNMFASLLAAPDF